MKKLWPWILALALILTCLYALDKKPDGRYWVARAEYDQAIADMDAGMKETLRQLAERDVTIKAQDELIFAGQKKIAELKNAQQTQALTGKVLADENARLKRDAAEAIAANPAVRALIENYDLRCVNYEKQIFTLTQAGVEKDKVIAAQDIKIVAVTFQRDAWKKSFDDEHALRLAGDSLRLDLEKQYKSSRFWRALGKWGPPVTFGLGLILGK